MIGTEVGAQPPARVDLLELNPEPTILLLRSLPISPATAAGTHAATPPTFGPLTIGTLPPKERCAFLIPYFQCVAVLFHLGRKQYCLSVLGNLSRLLKNQRN